MCFSRRQTTLQRRWPLPIPITRVNRSGIPKCDQTSRVAPVNDKLGIVHVIVVTPKLIDPIRDTRRRLDVRASSMCGQYQWLCILNIPRRPIISLLKSGYLYQSHQNGSNEAQAGTWRGIAQPARYFASDAIR
jgi:hypothetical protein